MNATTLREMMNEPNNPRRRVRLDMLRERFLDVLEAAEAFTKEDGRGDPPARYRELKAAIAALYRRAGEVML